MHKQVALQYYQCYNQVITHTTSYIAVWTSVCSKTLHLSFPACSQSAHTYPKCEHPHHLPSIRQRPGRCQTKTMHTTMPDLHGIPTDSSKFHRLHVWQEIVHQKHHLLLQPLWLLGLKEEHAHRVQHAVLRVHCWGPSLKMALCPCTHSYQLWYKHEKFKCLAWLGEAALELIAGLSSTVCIMAKFLSESAHSACNLQYIDRLLRIPVFMHDPACNMSKVEWFLVKAAAKTTSAALTEQPVCCLFLVWCLLHHDGGVQAWR